MKVKKLIFVCGFNNYLGINEEYDNVNKSMYFDNLEDVKQYAKEIVCFYSDNDPYVRFDVERNFTDIVATEQVLIHNGGHINSESGYDTFEEIVSYKKIANFRNMKIKYVGNSRKFHFIYESFRQEKRKSLFV